MKASDDGVFSLKLGVKAVCASFFGSLVGFRILGRALFPMRRLLRPSAAPSKLLILTSLEETSLLILHSLFPFKTLRT